MSRARPILAVFDLVTSVGGVQSVMARLLPRLAERFDVAVLDGYQHPDYAHALEAAGVTSTGLGPAPGRRYVGGANPVARAVNLAKRAPWLTGTGLRLRRWVQARRPSVIWFNQGSCLSFFSPFLPAGGPAIVFHAHGLSSAAEVRGGPRIARRCARVFAVSEAVATQVRQAWPGQGNVTVVHNGVDPDDLRRRAETGAGPLPPHTPGQLVLVHPAVIGPHKQQHVAIDALAHLPPNTVLWLCGSVAEGGDAVYEEALRARALRLGLGERVHFLGWRRDVPSVLAAADVAILPSAEESFGMVLVEAMALGKPCVGADVGGIPEVVEHGRTGFVAVPEPRAFAAAVAPLLASAELRRTMGEAGRQKVERWFTLDRQAARVTAELETILSRRGASAA